MTPEQQQQVHEREVTRMDGRAYGQAFAMLVGIVLVLLWACGAFGAPPPQCTLPPRDGVATDDRLTALERRVAELCERLDRPTAQPAPSVAAGLEVQSAPPVTYTTVCGPNGCVAGPVSFTNPPPFQGAFYSPGPFTGFQGGFIASGGSMGIPIEVGGGCAGGNCGAAVPAGGFLRGGLFGRRR
jgi:hypothetical protein